MTASTIPRRSTPVEDLRPEQKLYAAISILQTYILAEDTALIPERIFGINRMKEPGLEIVERLLMDITSDVQEIGPSQIAPLFRKYEEFSRAAAEYQAPEGVDETKELERLFYEPRDRIEDQILKLPCKTAADFAAKAIIHSGKGAIVPNWSSDDLWKEARALVGMPEPKPVEA